MLKKAMLFLSLSVMIVFLLLCVNTPPNPFSPDNAKIDMVLKDSKGMVGVRPLRWRLS